MGQTLDKSGPSTPLGKLCKENPQDDQKYRRLSARLNKKLGNELWPLGGTWDLEKCKKAKEEVWKSNASQKWKNLMSGWTKIK